jgi:hypothetical protein
MGKARGHLAELERHVEWVRKHIGPSEVLDRRVAEISKKRAVLARATHKQLMLAPEPQSPSLVACSKSLASS